MFQTLGNLDCTPFARAFEETKPGACFDKMAPYIELHNKEISELLKKLQIELKGFKYSLVDVYSLFEEIRDQPSKFGKIICNFFFSLFLSLFLYRLTCIFSTLKFKVSRKQKSHVVEVVRTEEFQAVEGQSMNYVIMLETMCSSTLVIPQKRPAIMLPS